LAVCIPNHHQCILYYTEVNLRPVTLNRTRSLQWLAPELVFYICAFSFICLSVYSSLPVYISVTISHMESICQVNFKISPYISLNVRHADVRTLVSFIPQSLLSFHIHLFHLIHFPTETVPPPFTYFFICSNFLCT
jgi:hypothetical protein